MKKLTDFDLSTRSGRFRARKAGFDVPKRKAGMKPVDVESLIDKNGECWEWLGKKDRCGYGTFGKNYKGVKAHREMYERHYGKIPEGSILLHSCDNPGCVNPSHLSIGTHQDNQRDKFEKDRQAKGETVGSSKLTEKQVIEMREMYSFRKCTYKDLALKYGVSKDTVQKAVRGIYWRHLEKSST